MHRRSYGKGKEGEGLASAASPSRRCCDMCSGVETPPWKGTMEGHAVFPKHSSRLSNNPESVVQASRMSTLFRNPLLRTDRIKTSGQAYSTNHIGVPSSASYTGAADGRLRGRNMRTHVDAVHTGIKRACLLNDRSMRVRTAERYVVLWPGRRSTYRESLYL
jgi:hypothetical protein